MRKYDLVLADPAWPYWGDPNKDAAAGKHYDLMALEEIKAMPVREIVKPKAALFLWATGPLLPWAIEVMNSWGFHYRGVAWIWIKTRQDGGIIHGQGIRPTFTKPNAEFLLAGSTCKTGRPLPLMDEGMGQVVLAARSGHSSKPLEFHERIESLFGDVDRLELFARSRREGWDASGLEYDGSDYRKAEILPSSMRLKEAA